MNLIKISDETWKLVSPYFPLYTYSDKGGRPRLSSKKLLEVILYIKNNKLPWKAVPPEYGSKTALNDYYRAWAKEGVFHKLKDAGLLLRSELFCINSDWEKIDKLVEKQVKVAS